MRAAESRRLARADRLYADGAFAAAGALYEQILSRNPGDLDALRGRASALLVYGRNADDLCTVAAQCSDQCLYELAAECYGRARELDPENRDAIWGFADCSLSVGEDAAAIEGFRRYLELEPGEPETLHMLAALGEGPPPPRAADAFVSGYFDRFADTFDTLLVDTLSYRVPEYLFAALGPLLGEPRGQLAILDLGCGTGLCGAVLRDHAERLDGIDLSPAMLDKARARHIYDRLTEGEIERYLADTPDRYDLIVAGDVLSYFGPLADIFSGTARALQPVGLFAFSVEASDVDGHRLTPSGRYEHGREYIRRTAEGSGLREVCVRREALRFEYGEPVDGDVWVFEKTA